MPGSSHLHTLQAPVDAKARQHDLWAEYAPGYSEVVVEGNLMPEIREEYVNSLTPLLQGRTVRILDVASASGEPGISLAAALPQSTVIATDLAETYLPLGRARAERNGLADRVTFEAADGENLTQFGDASFDAVTCSLGLMFFPDERKGLAEFYRVLKPGGVLAVAVWASSMPIFAMGMDVATAIFPPPPDAPPPTVNTAMRFGDGVQLCHEIAEAGFKDVEHRQLSVTFTLAGGADDAWWTSLWKTPFPLKPAVMQAKAAGKVDAEEEAKKMLQAKFEEAGYFSEDGGVAGKGNMCNFILARKP